MFFLLLIVAILWGVVDSVRAQEAPHVVINEVMWAKAEYIELFNVGDEELSLDGWYLSRQKPPVSGVDQEEETIITFSAADKVSGHGYFLIEASESATSVASNKIKSSLGLVDGGVLLRLYAQDGAVIDSANQLGGWFAGENNAVGISMERTNSSDDGGVAENWHASVGNIGGRVGTPGQGNSEIATPTPVATVLPASTPVITPSSTPTVSPTPLIPIYSSNVHINEFLPDPTGDDTTQEFIELLNSDNEIVDLSGWILDDVASGGSLPFTIPEGSLISGKSFLTFLRTQTKISLNNDIDHVRLIRPDGIIQDDAAYSDTKEGHSYNRFASGAYEKSSTITPNSANVITAPSSPTPKVTVSSEEEKEGDISYDFSSKIFINEALPNPTGPDTEEEFIELISKDTTDINLFGWTLDDASGGSSPYHFTPEDIIPSEKIIVFFRSKTKIALNNDEDMVRLIDPNGKIISSLHYEPKVIEGQSYNRGLDGLFVWSDTSTPGNENTIYIQQKVSPTPKPKPAKKVSPTKKKATSKKGNTSSAIPRVLSAITSILPWPEDEPAEGLVSRSVVTTTKSFEFPQGRQGAFVFFGITVAFMQGFSGFSHKERIWQK